MIRTRLLKLCKAFGVFIAVAGVLLAGAEAAPIGKQAVGNSIGVLLLAFGYLIYLLTRLKGDGHARM